MLQIIFAFLAGVLTVAAPCILPMLPIILGASIGQTNKQRPLLIVSGFIVSFAATSLVLSVIINNLGLSPNTLRYTAIFILTLFAVFMIWPKPFELFSTKISGTINAAGQTGKGNSNLSALTLGLTLGILWTPCAGPILASIIALIALQGSSLKSLTLLIAYAVGSGLPMLAIAYGSQYMTTKIRWVAQYATRLQQIFGILVLGLAAAMFLQYDVLITNKLTAFFPQNQLEQKLVETKKDVVKSMKKIDFQNYGQAPEFTGIDNWIQSDPLTIKELRGKVVLVDFWTYSCINCIRTLPYVTKWYDSYKDQGFVVIGVHTPEFAFEKIADNVKTAMDRFGIKYPVAQDNNYGTWQAYSNQYWPAEYLIDQSGNIVYTHFGEGNYDHTENAIRQLLGLDKPASNEEGQDLSGVKSPEMYFGTYRLQYLNPEQSASTEPKDYILPKKLPLNSFGLKGTWQFFNEKIKCIKDCKLSLKFFSGKVYMVAASEDGQKTNRIKITVDGESKKDVNINMSQLYPLFESSNYAEHLIEIEPQPGLEAFTFTFG